MKIFKRIQTLALAAIMAVMSLGSTTAVAAEMPTVAETTALEENGYIAVPYGTTTLLNQSFNMSVVHTGSTRQYNYDRIWFRCQFKNQNGTALTDGTILAVRLYDATTGQKVTEWQDSSGDFTVRAFEIDRTHRYYFQYVVAYGTPNLHIQMQIQAYT